MGHQWYHVDQTDQNNTVNEKFWKTSTQDQFVPLLLGMWGGAHHEEEHIKKKSKASHLTAVGEEKK
jgi:hypothetical protein